MIEDAQLWTGFAGFGYSSLDQNPGGFGPAAFHAQDFLAGIHNPNCRTGAPPAARIVFGGRPAERLPYNGYNRLNHTLWQKRRLRRASESNSCVAKSKSTTAIIMKKPRR